MDDARLMASFGIRIFSANARNDGFRVIKYPLLVRRARGAFREKLNRHIRFKCIQVASAQFAYPLEPRLGREAPPMAKMRGGRQRALRALWAQPTHAA